MSKMRVNRQCRNEKPLLCLAACVLSLLIAALPTSSNAQSATSPKHSTAQGKGSQAPSGAKGTMPAPVSHPVNHPELLPASDFEAWVVTQGPIMDVKRIPPTSLETALLTRLRQGRETTDYAIVRVMAAWSLYESPAVGREGIKGPDGRLWPHSHQFVGVVLPFLSQRTELLARLHRESAELYIDEGREEDAVPDLEKAAELLKPKIEKLDRLALESLTILGETYLRHKEPKKAEACFLQVLSFPAFLVSEDAVGDFQEVYMRAGEGVLLVRRLDAQALRDTYFEDFAQRRLYPVRDAEIAELREQTNPPAHQP